MRDELCNIYVSGLASRIEALGEALDAFGRNEADAEASLRRIAHSLKGSGGTYGFPLITEVAGRAEHAEPAALAERIAALIQLLEETVQESAAAGPTKMILALEDDPDQIRILREALAAPDREIRTAETMAEAVAVIAENLPSLIILDLLLPDADGRQFLMKLRNDIATAGIPIVVVTARSGAVTRTECLALGANAFFEKPVDLSTFSITVANLLRQAALQERELRRDLLTGLPNRAALIEAYDRALALARRSKVPLAVAILDLDHFKLVNDTYGHAIGDLVLKEGAQCIERALRKADLLARWGGEEFVALLPETTAVRAAKALEGALLALREHLFRAEDGRTFTVTFSAGVVEATDMLSADEAVAAADLLLYHAKAGGRERIVHDEKEVIPVMNRIFLVEDDATIASFVTHRLTREGFEVDHFADPRVALETLASRAPKLVILDVNMPSMDGFTFLKAMRESSRLASIPVLMLTALGSEKDIVKGFELGASDYVVKPFSPGELTARVRRLLR